MELHLVAAQHLGAQLSHHLTVYGDNASLNELVSFTTAANAGIGEELVQTDWLIGIIVLLLILNTLLEAVLGIRIVIATLLFLETTALGTVTTLLTWLIAALTILLTGTWLIAALTILLAGTWLIATTWLTTEFTLLAILLAWTGLVASRLAVLLARTRLITTLLIIASARTWLVATLLILVSAWTWLIATLLIIICTWTIAALRAAAL